LARETETTPPDRGLTGRLPRWIPLLVAAAAFLVYVNTLGNGFVFDDIPIVVENPNIRGLSKIPLIFTSGYGEGTQLGFTALYRPIVILSLAVNYQIGGLAPWHYHLVNCLLHAANALLVVFLASRISRRLFIITAAGLLFALHPVNTEAVAPVVGRTDLLGTFFSLCSLLLYAKYISAQKRRIPLLAGSLACLAAGLLSKEHAVVVPGLIMLWDVVKRDGSIWIYAGEFPRRLLTRYSLFILVVAAYLCVRFAVVGSIGVGGTISELDNPLTALGQPTRFFTAGKVSLAYLSRLLVPVTLSHDYSYPQIQPAGAAEGLAFIFVAAVFAWLLVHFLRKDGRIFYGLAFFAIAFSIVSNLVFIIGTIMAERLLYLPGVGFCLAVAVLLSAGKHSLHMKISKTFGQWAVISFLTVVCILFATRTIIRNADWRSQLTIYQQAVRVVPYNAKVRMGYGQTLSEHRRYYEALDQFGHALKLLGPDREKRFAYIAADILFDMANIYKKEGRFEEAISTYGEARKLRKDRPEFIFNLGRTLLAAGRPGEAVEMFENYLKKDPEYHEAHNELALALEALGDYRGAKKSFLESIRLKPDYAKAHRNLALLYVVKLNEHEKAIPHLEKTLKFDPGQPDADKFREAIRQYRKQKGNPR